MTFRCIKVGKDYEIQISIGNIWKTYHPYSGASLDSITSKIMDRKYARFSTTEAKEAYDMVTQQLLAICISSKEPVSTYAEILHKAEIERNKYEENN